MMNRIYLVDAMAPVVQAVSDKLTVQLKESQSVIEGVWYMFGHPLEIMQRLAAKDKSGTFAFKKYPLVILVTDFAETKGNLEYASQAQVTILVVHSTTADRIADDRKEIVFKPILHPIVDELMRQIEASEYFLDYDADQIERTETDRYYWGKAAFAGNTGNYFNDLLDAVEIQVTLRLNPFCQLPPGAKNIR